MPQILFITLLLLLLGVPSVRSQQRAPVVADSDTRTPLPHASIFDRHGNFIGACDANGRMPHIAPEAFPATVRYMGYHEATVASAATDTVFLRENVFELREVVVESRQRLLHILAYIREYSTLTTYSDTIFLFREKMVDYMLPADTKKRRHSWTYPRILSAKSYYRFTDGEGLDSVSDRYNHHFSWVDWMGFAPPVPLPSALRGAESATDTVYGRYSPTEIWAKTPDRVRIDVNVMADTMSRKWVPRLNAFFHGELDFDQFRIYFNYDNTGTDTLRTIDLNGYSFTIETTGRGRGVYLFTRDGVPYFVNSYAEVYLVDKEFITPKEAAQWEKMAFDKDDIAIYEPAEAPPLHPAIMELIARVNGMDHDIARLGLRPDERLAGRRVVKQQNLAQRAFALFKTLTGISKYRSERKWNRQWKDFRDKQKKRE